MGYGKKQMIKHSIKRAKERYDLILTKQDIDSIVDKIQNGESIQVEGRGTPTRTRKFHKVLHNGVPMVVLYSKSAKTLVTCFPPDANDYQINKLMKPDQGEDFYTTVECPTCEGFVVLYQPREHSEYVPSGTCPNCSSHVFMFLCINEGGELTTQIRATEKPGEKYGTYY